MEKDIYCPACGHKQMDNHIEEYNYQLEAIPTRYLLYMCINCGLEFWHPRTILREFYEEDKFSLYIHSYLKSYSYTTPFLKYPPAQGGKLLDVGCGEGLFLLDAQRLGFEAHGIDLSQNAIERANAKGLKNVYRMFLKEFIEMAMKKGLKFDVISFFEVLEHQDDLDNFINDIKLLLKPDGWIVGSVPYKSYGAGDYPPHHFTLWRERPLELFLKRNFGNVTIKGLYDISYTKGILLGSMTKKMSILISKSDKRGSSQENEISRSRIVFYRVLKTIRDILFYPIDKSEKVVRVILKKPTNYYFQAQNIGKVKRI